MFKFVQNEILDAIPPACMCFKLWTDLVKISKELFELQLIKKIKLLELQELCAFNYL